MLPIPFRMIFRSRWVAALWAAGIIWLAYDLAVSEPADDNSSANADQVEQALNVL